METKLWDSIPLSRRQILPVNVQAVGECEQCEPEVLWDAPLKSFTISGLTLLDTVTPLCEPIPEEGPFTEGAN